MAKKRPVKPKTKPTAGKPKNPKKPGRVENLKPWKPGQSGNPLGSAHPSFQLRKLTESSLKEALEQVFTANEEEVTRLLNDPRTTVGHKILLRAAIDAAQHGRWEKFNSMLERAIGKVPDNINLRSPDGSMSPVQPQNLKNLSTEDLQHIKAIHGKLNPASVAPSGGEGTGET